METSSMENKVRRENPSRLVTIKSKVLGEDRRIYIQLPEGYNQTRKAYPILFVLDGEWLYEIVRANLRFYAEYEVMGILLPKMIVVGIENVDRDRDYVPTQDPQDPPLFETAGQADAFAEFLSHELIPYLEENYRASQGRAVVGWSFGGLFAMYAALQHQDLFDSFLCIGPAVWWDDELVGKLFKEIPIREKKQAVITCGTLEKGGEVYDSVQNLLQILEEEQPNNLEYDYIEIEGAGHSWAIPEAVDRGLKSLYKDYLPTGEFNSLAELMDYYACLSRHWGYDVLPPDRTMIKLANDLWAKDERTQALGILDKLLSISPDSSLGHFYRGKYLALLDQIPDAIESLQEAIDRELTRPVPNFVYLRSYQKKLKQLLQAGQIQE